MATVRECLDRGEDFPQQVSPHALVEALTSFLLALPTPLIPQELYPSVVRYIVLNEILLFDRVSLSN